MHESRHILGHRCLIDSSVISCYPFNRAGGLLCKGSFKVVASIMLSRNEN